MKSIIFLMIVFVAGCQSEVDKCVNSTMAAWDVRQDRVKKEWSAWKNDEVITTEKSKDSREFSLKEALLEKPDERSRIEVESIERKRCMRFAAGK